MSAQPGSYHSESRECSDGDVDARGVLCKVSRFEMKALVLFYIVGVGKAGYGRIKDDDTRLYKVLQMMVGIECREAGYRSACMVNHCSWSTTDVDSLSVVQ